MPEERVERPEDSETPTNPLRAAWRIDPKRPVYSALLEAEFRRSDWLYCGTFTRRMSNTTSDEEAREVISELLTVLDEASEIMDWIMPQQEPVPFDISMSIATMLRQAGAPEKVCKEMIARAGKMSKGRPVTKRPIAIMALEKQLLEPERKWSYRVLAQQFCNCAKDKHDNECAQSLRQAMIALKKIVAKYAPHLPVNKSG
jgi:hypothetical protein